ncbi:tetratricopeptide repeat protein [Clostridium sp. SM-530-WT-3G]|uniref:tetratricopeptide repeat protein n=1 Tax=Clostridium sp. SM-530-WT-3G TaxID=2725303 RepID=UPI00145F64A2|nr:tetratricopeptide repeat protein [Clostridium sp. SM-530-WT-3G]NME83518.1 hypothetical protein [Clostridium sp. SM-530-WT-3G]
MNIKLPGSLRVKKIILIILVIISVYVISYELIQNKNSKKDNINIIQEQIIGEDNSNNTNKDNSEVLNDNTSDKNEENLYSEKEEGLYTEAYNLFFSNKYEEAIKKADILLEEFPQNPKGYNIRGIAKAYNGDYDGGIKDIDKSLQISPDYGYALFNKGLTYELYGNMEEALNWYNKDLEVEEYEWTYYGIASIYGRRGDVDNTVKYLKKAIEINPEVKEEAKTEKDFNPVKSSKDFENLINS